MGKEKKRRGGVDNCPKALDCAGNCSLVMALAAGGRKGVCEIDGCSGMEGSLELAPSLVSLAWPVSDGEERTRCTQCSGRKARLRVKVAEESFGRWRGAGRKGGA